MRLIATIITLALAPIPAAQASAPDWDGAYGGVTAGYEWVDDEATAMSILALPIVPPIGQTLHGNGPSAGAIIGYRTAIGPIVAGLEASADAPGAGFDRNAAGSGVKLATKWGASARLIAGVPAGRVLIFGAIGVAAVRTEYSYSLAPAPNPYRRESTRSGLSWGLGAEAALGKFHPRLEYRRETLGTVVNEADTLISTHRTAYNLARLSIVVPF